MKENFMREISNTNQENEDKRLAGVKVGFAVTGSHCTLAEAVKAMEEVRKAGAEITPILSFSVKNEDTKFGKAEDWRGKISEICGNPIIDSIVLAEPIGPQRLLDVLLIAPCSGNTLAKLALGISDSPVLMAAKAHLRNQKPLVLAISTNDGLGANAKNLGLLLNTKNVYMVPFGQDNPKEKAGSLLSDMKRIPGALTEALAGRQLQPLLLQYKY
ncbi:MAG: dipicolinate synthase subunit B [Clostridiales bacterium]|nr:dipicolinate synthase subunit B [Clostridiales bacterium]